MSGANLGEDLGLYDDLFDFADDGTMRLDTFYLDDFPSIWAGVSDGFPAAGPILSDDDSNGGSSAPALFGEIDVPCDDICVRDWIPMVVEDSIAGDDLILGEEQNNLPDHSSSSLDGTYELQVTSPVSVLDSSRSTVPSSGKSCLLSPTPGSHQRARSKRPRPATHKRVSNPVCSPRVKPERFFEADCPKNTPGSAAPEQGEKSKKQRKWRKLAFPPAKEETSQDQEVRKCLHCDITKTPQWRAGPKGPKTLCNACGVRHKSGRLFPEYRPAASPTFVPSLHSNSHKKVLQMRTKGMARSNADMEAESESESSPKVDSSST